jgi:UDP-glucose 4-epimerase
MRVLVTGGAGFIGSHVVDKLLERGIQVYVYDLPGVRHRLPASQATFIPGSILDLESLRVAVAGMDAVYHLAAIADVKDVFEDPHYAEMVNVRGTINVLEAARRARTPRVIYGSTTWAYSEADDQVVDEDTLLKPPVHLYTATKLTSEYYCMCYDKLYGVAATVLRYGIPYGPRARDGAVIPNFVSKALKGEPLTIAGDGSQFRQFIYVEDLAEGNALALKPVARHRTYNLDGAEKVTIKQIAETIRNIIGPVTIQYTEGRPGDFAGKECLSVRAREELDWQPKVSLEDGIRRYIQWYKARESERGEEWSRVDSNLRGPVRA